MYQHGMPMELCCILTETDELLFPKQIMKAVFWYFLLISVLLAKMLASSWPMSVAVHDLDQPTV